jgi:hypothetical protein
VPIEQIKSKVFVETSETFRERTTFPNNVFYFRDFYNPSAPETSRPVTRYTQSQATQHTQAMLTMTKERSSDEEKSPDRAAGISKVFPRLMLYRV